MFFELWLKDSVLAGLSSMSDELKKKMNSDPVLAALPWTETCYHIAPGNGLDFGADPEEAFAGLGRHLYSVGYAEDSEDGVITGAT